MVVGGVRLRRHHAKLLIQKRKVTFDDEQGAAVIVCRKRLIILWSAVQVRDALPFHTVKSLCTTLQSDFFCVFLLENTNPIDRVRRLFEGFLSFKRAFNLIGMLQII